MFYIRRPSTPDDKGKELQTGRTTKTMASSRPPTVWVEVWTTLSKKQRAAEIQAWEQIKPKYEQVRKDRGIESAFLPDEEREKYKKVMQKAIAEYGIAAVPVAMPLKDCGPHGVAGTASEKANAVKNTTRPHQDQEAAIGNVSG